MRNNSGLNAFLVLCINLKFPELMWALREWNVRRSIKKKKKRSFLPTQPSGAWDSRAHWPPAPAPPSRARPPRSWSHHVLLPGDDAELVAHGLDLLHDTQELLRTPVVYAVLSNDADKPGKVLSRSRNFRGRGNELLFGLYPKKWQRSGWATLSPFPLRNRWQSVPGTTSFSPRGNTVERGLQVEGEGLNWRSQAEYP